MPTPPTCPSCQADMPLERTVCAACGDVRCWACGSANAADEAFCRRCGVWLVGRETSAPTRVAADRPSDARTRSQGEATTVGFAEWDSAAASTPTPVVATTLRLERGRRRSGRRLAFLTVTLTVALTSVGAVAALRLPAREPSPPALAAAGGDAAASDAGPTDGTAVPEEEAALDVEPTHRGAVADDLAGPAAKPSDPEGAEQVQIPIERTAAPTVEPPTMRSGSGAGGAGTAPEPSQPAPPVTDPAERSGSDAPARAASGWVCEDSVRLADANGRRWTVDRVSFRAMGGYERIILHLDQDGSASSAATAFGAPIASSGTQGSSRSRARSAARRGIGIELTGGIRTGLELRGYRPQGLRTIRDLSIQRDGPASRVFITVSSDGCFRMRAPAWQRGRSASSAELIVDVRR